MQQTAYYHLQAGVGFFCQRRLRCSGGGFDSLPPQLAQKGPVALQVGGAVIGIKKDLPPFSIDKKRVKLNSNIGIY